MSIANPLNLPFALAPVMQNDIIRVLGQYTFIRLDNGDEAFITTGTGSSARTRAASSCQSRMIRNGAGTTW
jgi:hypothetical protein